MSYASAAAQERQISQLLTDDDSLEMRDAVFALVRLGLRVRRPSPYQLKIGKLNFYPGKGTIYPDNRVTMIERGLDHFIRIALAEEARGSGAEAKASSQVEGGDNATMIGEGPGVIETYF